MKNSNSIYPCIWCNNNAREMAGFYCATFPDTHISDENPAVVMLEMSGQKLMLLNGGDRSTPNPSISLMYLTMSENEVETIWNKLVQDGESMMPLDAYPFSPKYGWVQDKYGVSWQLYTARDETHIVQKIAPTLMFVGDNNGKAREAAGFYTSLFPHSQLRGMLAYTGEEGEVAGNIQHGEFIINDYLLMLMDSSWEHKFSFSEGVSLVVECDSQEEIDTYWNALTADGGEESMCGWLKDRFGISWQIVPARIYEWLKKSPGVMDEVMKMKKLDIKTLREASESTL